MQTVYMSLAFHAWSPNSWFSEPTESFPVIESMLCRGSALARSAEGKAERIHASLQ